MFFGAWATKDPIPITGHSYEDFKEFLTYLYLGCCKIDHKNVMALVDLAESYDVKLLKGKCDRFLMGTEPSLDTVLKIYESLKLYSLEDSLQNYSSFIASHCDELLQSAQFLNAKKETVLDIVQMEQMTVKEEALFEAVSFHQGSS